MQTSSYYRSIEIQYAAGQGPERYQVDSKLTGDIAERAKGERDGRISEADAEALVQRFRDGGRYGAGEKPLAKAMLAARDDRNIVTIDGQRIRLTDGAESAFTKGMQKFWGELGAKAKLSKIDNTQQAVGQFAQQISQS